MKAQHFFYAMIGLNTALFLAQLMGWDMRPFAALYPLNHPELRWWQWFTHIFLHENILHLLLNMYAIYFFGAPVLATMKTRKFALLYLLGGLVGGALYNLVLAIQTPAAYVPHSQMLGASGAAFAILAAFAMRFPNAPLGIMFLPFEFKAKYFVMAIVAYEIFATFSGVSLFGSNIAHMAHVGGAIVGCLLTWLWRKRHIHLVK